MTARSARPILPIVQDQHDRVTAGREITRLREVEKIKAEYFLVWSLEVVETQSGITLCASYKTILRLRAPQLVDHIGHM